LKTIALFGGTGFVGSRLQQKLIEQGFAVRMLVRDPEQSRLMPLAGKLSTVCGTLEDPAAVNDTLTGCDACIVTTGARSNSAADMHAVVTGTQYIIKAMHAQQINRLIKLSGVSVRIGNEPFPLMRRLLDIGLKIAMPNPSKSKYLEQDLIASSGLSWTVVRPPVISDDPINKTFAVHTHNYLGLKINLDDLCDFMIQQLDNDTWQCQSPVVGYR